jgi:tyrosinase
MARMRMDVARLGGPWNDTLLWYARGVRLLQTRELADRTSWRFLAAMHGIDTQLWRGHGYLTPGDLPPSDWDQQVLWNQCQHQSWFFLPWHRGYVAAFESIVRDAIVKLGGPADWALPYWNYFAPTSNSLPPAFLEPTMPDGASNPLYVQARYGDGSGNVTITSDDISYDALNARSFSGDSGTAAGFGGLQTVFHHGKGTNGQLESDPHNTVHSLVGGRQEGANPRDMQSYGLMSLPNTAALDPIFWLHHANIDRLWAVWLARDAAHADPSRQAWLTGPADRRFVVPTTDGNTVEFTPGQVRDTKSATLDYFYQDISDPLHGSTRAQLRLQRLQQRGLPAFAAVPLHPHPMGGLMPIELLGASAAPVALDGGIVTTTVDLDHQTVNKVAASFALLPQIDEPDRVFLNLENVRGNNDAAVFYVYVNLPNSERPEDHRKHKAGVLSLFGVSQASTSAHGANGITQVLEITDVIDQLHLENPGSLDRLQVQFVPRTKIVPEHEITVDRVSVFRKGR